MKRWKVRLDVDDIIFSCNEYAVELTNSELHLTPPIQMNEITAWGPLGTRADLRLKYFKSKKFGRFIRCYIDDGIHNLRRTTAEYPVLMQRPWNVAEKNYVTVSGFEEFLAFMRSISI